MLLEDFEKPLHFTFSVGDLHFRAEDFEDKLIRFSISDEGGLQVGGLVATFDEAGENVDLSDSRDFPGTLDNLRSGKESDDSISRKIKQVIKSTF